MGLRHELQNYVSKCATLKTIVPGLKDLSVGGVTRLEAVPGEEAKGCDIAPDQLVSLIQ